ncbi:ester cyclase [Nocardia sp. NPDC004278]
MNTTPADLVARFYRDIATDGRDELIEEVFAPDFVVHSRPGGPARAGIEQVLASLETLRSGFADLRFDIEDVVSAGDRVAARWTLHGRHVGALFGVPASGREITQSGMVFYHTREGRLAEQWVLVDTDALTAA